VLWVVAGVGFEAPKVKVPPVEAAVVVVAETPPNENEVVDAGVGATADPKEGATVTEVTAPNAGGAVILAGVDPNVNNPGAPAAVVTGAVVMAAPKVNGLTAATDTAVVVALVTDEPNVGAEDEAATPEKVKSPDTEDVAVADNSVFVEDTVVAPKLNGLVSAVDLLDPKAGGAVVVKADWPKENVEEADVTDAVDA